AARPQDPACRPPHLVAAREGLLLADEAEVRDPGLPSARVLLRVRFPDDGGRPRPRHRGGRAEDHGQRRLGRHGGARRSLADLRITVHAVRDVVRHGVEQGSTLSLVRATSGETNLGVPTGARDRSTVGPDGEVLHSIEGVEIARLSPHVDHRGSLVEVVNFAHAFWDEDVVYAYCITIRPGRIKGWGMHKRQSDRYFLVSGSVRVVLYDGRDDSRTRGSFEIHNLTREAWTLLRI